MSVVSKLIVGLGNPGNEYNGTRHNIGFSVIDAINEEYNFSSNKQKFDAHIADFIYKQKKIISAKPTTYMNNSGLSIRKISDYYKISIENIIVIHDDIDLEVGKIKIKQAGGHAGHNGLKSLDQHIGKNYWRIRVGVSHPGDRNLVSNYVLGRFSKEHANVMENQTKLIAKDFEFIFEDKFDSFLK